MNLPKNLSKLFNKNVVVDRSHSVKSVRIRSCYCPCFPAFGLNTWRHGVSLQIQSECGKIRTRITPNMDTFHAVLVAYHVCLYIRFEKKLQINQQLVTLFHLLINNQSHFFIFQRFVSPKVIRTYKLRHEFPNYSSSGSQEITNFQESLEIRCRTYDRVHLPKTKTDNSSEKLKKGLLKHASDVHVNQC